jgi:hypothetical protein
MEGSPSWGLKEKSLERPSIGPRHGPAAKMPAEGRARFAKARLARSARRDKKSAAVA